MREGWGESAGGCNAGFTFCKVQITVLVSSGRSSGAAEQGVTDIRGRTLLA